MILTHADVVASARRPAIRAVTLAAIVADTRATMAKLAGLPEFADPDTRLRGALGHVRETAGADRFDRTLAADRRFPDGEALVAWVRARVGLP